MREQRYDTAKVSRRAEESIQKGHPWVYDTEVDLSAAAGCPDGGIVRIVNGRGAFLAYGFVNRHSKIRLRLLTRNPNEQPDTAPFYRRRLKRAVDYRKTVMGEQFECCRLVYGEADALPGLTVDRFGSVLVVQTLCLGIEQRKQMIFEQLLEVLSELGESITGVFERNDVNVRNLEGMEQNVGWLIGSGSTDVIITENGIKYHVDIEKGQKTGFFLDQKFNRQAVADIAKGLRVLDCFTHTGSFALNCAKGGASSVTAIDISQDAIDQAERNAQLNGFEQIEFKCANCFDELPRLKRGEYDMIILDPPAFTKSRATIDSAVRGYKEINLRAMKALNGGGYLATCSCSHFVDDRKFCEMLRAAAADAGVSLRQIEARQQAKDHPMLWGVDETGYLKFYIFQKM